MYSCSNDNNIIIKKYDSGTIMSVVNLKNGVRDGYSYYYYPNGYIKSIEYYKNDTANGDFVSFDEDGQLEGYAKYKNNLLVFYQLFDGKGNIYKSSTFMTIQSRSDTITLGKPYISHVLVNFWKYGYTCGIYKRKEGSDSTNVLYDQIGIAPQATFSILPTQRGEYTYEISTLQKKYLSNSDSVVDYIRSAYIGKYWVK